MEKARGQAERYVRALPASEGNPPFVVVVDVGHTIELYADFSRLGKTYTLFPDARSHRIALTDLARPEIRARLAAVWADPLSLDPTRRTAKVTRVVADRLARLAKSFEATGHSPETVAEFLMRCIFTFFAEDVKLIKDNAFTALLESLRGQPENFPHLVQPVWRDMDKGSPFSPVLRQKILQFNGGLFEHTDALPLSEAQLGLLIDAAHADWADVEPAIFGTLLERALSPDERHKLGAHYTPRAYVERLVLPTVIEPLREQFDAAKAAAFTLNFNGDAKAARAAIGQFLNDLANTTVLDPACGTGNFLYVTMDHMKRLEEEARDVLRQLGQQQEVLEFSGLTVDPHQFLGLEINPRAVAIADLVLWIGYLQFHYRTRGNVDPQPPILRAFHNIRQQDAVLAYDAREVVTDESGKPVSRWDGRTMKPSPVTGEDVPDETARVPVYRYVNPRKAEWPKADYVVGNPPFLGKLYIVGQLGTGYAEALRDTYDKAVPDSADFVMYWWHKAAALLGLDLIRRFGFITTNSITQTFNRRVVSDAQNSSSSIGLAFAIPDHPWVDTADGAAVRIAMTVGTRGKVDGRLLEIASEREATEARVVEFAERLGPINPDLTIGTNIVLARPLAANKDLASMGPSLGSRGFVVEAAARLKLIEEDGYGLAPRIRPLRNGRDLLGTPRGVFAIDLYGIETAGKLQHAFPATFQHLYHTVYPERAQNNDPKLRTFWWQFRRSNEDCRQMLAGLSRFIVTVETAKYRTFFLAPADILAEHGTISFGFDDPYFLGVMSSKFHVIWALATGGTLEDRPRYNKTVCFDPFPFPAATETQQARIRELGESLDAHRKRQQAAHPGLTITDMYNVLAKLRSGESLSDKDRRVHEQGLVSVLRQIHDDLDAAVAEAYGWPADLADDEVLRRLVALNAERAAEERRGLVRWLRPAFQNPAGHAAAVQADLDLPPAAATAAAGAGAGPKPAKRSAWPKALPEQVRAVKAALQSRPAPATAADVARAFAGAKAAKVAELLETLALLGQARAIDGGRYVA